MRIISGFHKGRTLLAPVGRTTRPITDQAKLALFNILGATVTGALVLDLFCGTGSLGLEALSRGGRFCCFADADAGAIDRLKRNIAAVGEEARTRVWRGDVLRRLADWLTEVPEPVDLAFVDPPYAMVEQWQWSEAADRLFEPLGRCLAAGGRAVLRCPRRARVPESLGRLRVSDRRAYGGMSLVFLVPAAGGGSVGET